MFWPFNKKYELWVTYNKDDRVLGEPAPIRESHRFLVNRKIKITPKHIKFKDDTWSLLEFQNINLALVTQEEHPNHFAVVDERLSKNKKMKYHRDGIGYIYSQDIDNNFIEIINRKS